MEIILTVHRGAGMMGISQMVNGFVTHWAMTRLVVHRFIAILINPTYWYN